MTPRVPCATGQTVSLRPIPKQVFSHFCARPSQKPAPRGSAPTCPSFSALPKTKQEIMTSGTSNRRPRIPSIHSQVTYQPTCFILNEESCDMDDDDTQKIPHFKPKALIYIHRAWLLLHEFWGHRPVLEDRQGEHYATNVEVESWFGWTKKEYLGRGAKSKRQSRGLPRIRQMATDKEKEPPDHHQHTQEKASM